MVCSATATHLPKKEISQGYFGHLNLVHMSLFFFSFFWAPEKILLRYLFGVRVAFLCPLFLFFSVTTSQTTHLFQLVSPKISLFLQNEKTDLRHLGHWFRGFVRAKYRVVLSKTQIVERELRLSLLRFFSFIYCFLLGLRVWCIG